MDEFAFGRSFARPSRKEMEMSLKTPRHRFPSSWVWLISACALVAFISACGGGAASLSAWTPTPTTSPSPLAYTVLHAFNGADGSHPRAGLMRDSAGNLYGTTAQGGEGTNNYYGTVFKIDSSGSLRVLHSFNGADGKHPHSVLIMDSAGNLYGTTYLGGANGYGTAFKIDSNGAHSVLHDFGRDSDGALLFAGLSMDNAGNLYGTTRDGGSNNKGTIFKIDHAGIYSVLHAFGSGGDGAHPRSRLARDSAGNWYVTSSEVGANDIGTVFKIDSSGNYSVLRSFNFGAEGCTPYTGLAVDSAGNLYGTTYNGGANGLGVVFKIDHSGSYSVLHSFGSDGRAAFGDLIVDSAGNVYGATNDGGANDEGSVFKITSSGSHSVLHSFSKDSDGRYPYVGLIMDSAGNLYGTASGGGTNAMGTVFRLGAN
jgi:uncharacterized repeat protein (TIGR03803 family)